MAKAISEILYTIIPQPIRQEIEEKIINAPDLLSSEEKEQLYIPLSVKIILAIRSDRMSLLDKLREYIPDIFNQFYELLPMDKKQAKEAIIIPASLPSKENEYLSNNFSFENESLNKILNFLSKDNTQEIETFQLQILCSYLEKKVIDEKIQIINDEHIKDIGEIYKNFYDNILENLNPVEQKAVRNFIEEGLIYEEEERRLTLYQGQIETKYHVRTKLLKWLEDTHIIRSEPSSKGGYIYELSHDSLIKPILDSKRQHELGKYAGLSKKEIEDRKKLEKLIEERTLQIEMQKEEVMYQRDEIESQRDKIASQRDILAKQNQNIIEAIIYANRIQKAMMTPAGYIQTVLPDHFIIFRPKNIVSGDFYWIKKIQNQIYVAVADCTGHGVPGAMVSILGLSLLKDIFKNEVILDVNRVLDKLLEELIRTFHQTGTEEEIRDGMDIALCLIDMDNYEMQYAGARHPAYLIRNGELIQYRPDQQAIALPLHPKKPFTLQRVKLEKNDAIYLFTDGYVDQFGGESMVKFKRRNFRSLLQSVQNNSMNEQKRILEETLNEWQGSNEQVDDILVFGIKL